MKPIRRVHPWGPLPGKWESGANIALTFKRIEREQAKARAERDKQFDNILKMKRA